MKLTSSIKYINGLLLVLLMGVLAACSSDDNNELDEPGGSQVSGLKGMIPASVLPGEWIFESAVNNKTGEKKIINRAFTILPFQVKKTSNNVISDSSADVWAEAYDPFTSVITVDGIETNDGGLAFCQPRGVSLQSSLVYEIMMSLTTVDSEDTDIIVAAELYYSDGILTAKSSAYDLTSDLLDSNYKTLTFKKVK